MKKDTYSYAAITDALQKHGPMTLPQISTLMGCKLEQARRIVWRYRRRHPGERFCVVDYVPRASGVGAHIAMYAAHGGEDLPRPAHVPSEKKVLAPPPRQANYAYIAESDKLVIPVERRPLCNGTAQGKYTGSELSYRGQR